MKKWWIGVVVAAMSVGQSAWAQSPPPGGGPLPEPAPVAPCPPQDKFTYGPMTGAAAPPGPGDCLSLPASLPTAWGKGPIPESDAYVNFGTMAYMRQRPGHTIVAEGEGLPALDTNYIRPGYQWGGRLTVGYLCDDAAIELTGFYIPEANAAAAGTFLAGGTNLFFTNAPVGFQGNTGNIFQGADAALVSLQSMLADGELNYRWFSRSFTGFEGVLGFRYLELQERARIMANAQAVNLFNTGVPDPTLSATYQNRVHNHMIMGQGGYDWSCCIKPWLMASTMFRLAVGADDVDQTTRLYREDGLNAFNVKRNHWTGCALTEFGVYFDWLFLDKVRLRMGWQLLWVLHVDEAFQQVGLDLANQPAPGKGDGGSIFYQGPVIELQLLF
jgi:hypothetical protein